MASNEQQAQLSTHSGALDDFFRSPIDTLLESVEDESMEKIYLYDLIQAYGLFSARAKKLSEVLSDNTKRADATTYLKEHSSAISSCLVRDIRRVIAPLHSPEDSNDASYEPTKEELDEARDKSSLAQHALVLLAQVFSLPDRPHIFNDEDAAQLLQSILDVLNEPSIPAPGEKKTRSLAVWVLSIFDSSSKVFADHSVDVLRAVTSIVTSGNDAEISVRDALKVLHNTLVQNPRKYLPSSLDLLAHVLQYLIAPSTQLRKSGAFALVGYARALLAHNATSSLADLPCRNILSTRICDFVVEQRRLHKVLRKDPNAASSSLVDLVRAEIPQDGSSPPGPHVGWAFSVLHALLVLSDGQIFRRPDFLKFVAQTVEPCLDHDSQPLHVLHSGVWRAFVWAFTRVPHLDEEEEAKWLPPSQLNGFSVREAVLKTVRQLPKYNVGCTLVFALMGPGKSPTRVIADTELGEAPFDEEDVVRAISVIKQLMSDEARDKRIEAIQLMTVCTANEVDPNICGPWDTRRILQDSMFELELVDADYGRIQTLTKEMKVLMPGHVRIFSDEELVKHWELLVDIWDEAVREAVQIGGKRALDIESRLICTWQGLLRAQQRSAELSDDQVAARATKVIVAYLDWEPCCPLIKRPFQGCIVTTRLKSVRQLILGAKAVLSQEVMTLVSRDVLASILGVNIKPPSDEAKAVWVEICSELCAFGDTAHIVTQRRDPRLGTKQEQWCALVDAWPKVGTPRSWKALVAFLTIPFANWHMGRGEQYKASELLDYAIAGAKQSRVGPNQVLELFIRHIPATARPLEHDSLLKLIPKLSLRSNDIIPTHFLTRVNEYLCDYTIMYCQQMIPMLSTTLAQSSTKMVVPFLVLLQQGMGQWLSQIYALDIRKREQQYDNYIIPFYYTAMSVLRSVPLRVEDLESLDDFLVAPFARPNYPKKALQALNDYWETVESSWQNLVGNKAPPPGLEKWISQCHYTYRTKRPCFLPDSSVSSQSEVSMTTVPDSQPEEDEASGDDIQDDFTTPKARKVTPPSPRDKEDTNRAGRVAPQAPGTIDPQIRSSATPVARPSPRNTRHGPLEESSLNNSLRPKQTTTTSVLGKRRVVDTEEPAEQPQRKRAAVTVSTRDMPSDVETGAMRVRGGRGSLDSSVGDRKESGETKSSDEHSLPTPPSSFEIERPLTSHVDLSGKEDHESHNVVFYSPDNMRDVQDTEHQGPESPLQAVRRASELLRLSSPDMPMEEVMEARELLNEMDDMLQERLRIHTAESGPGYTR